MPTTKWWVKVPAADVKVERASTAAKKVEPAKAKTAEPKVEKPTDE